MSVKGTAHDCQITLRHGAQLTLAKKDRTLVRTHRPQQNPTTWLDFNAGSITELQATRRKGLHPMSFCGNQLTREAYHSLSRVFDLAYARTPPPPPPEANQSNKSKLLKDLKQVASSLLNLVG
jgi:hypothetical protein